MTPPKTSEELHLETLLRNLIRIRVAYACFVDEGVIKSSLEHMRWELKHSAAHRAIKEYMRRTLLMSVTGAAISPARRASANTIMRRKMSLNSVRDPQTIEPRDGDVFRAVDGSHRLVAHVRYEPVKNGEFFDIEDQRWIEAPQSAPLR